MKKQRDHISGFIQQAKAAPGRSFSHTASEFSASQRSAGSCGGSAGSPSPLGAQAPVILGALAPAPPATPAMPATPATPATPAAPAALAALAPRGHVMPPALPLSGPASFSSLALVKGALAPAAVKGALAPPATPATPAMPAMPATPAMPAAALAAAARAPRGHVVPPALPPPGPASFSSLSWMSRGGGGV